MKFWFPLRLNPSLPTKPAQYWISLKDKNRQRTGTIAKLYQYLKAVTLLSTFEINKSFINTWKKSLFYQYLQVINLLSIIIWSLFENSRPLLFSFPTADDLRFLLFLILTIFLVIFVPFLTLSFLFLFLTFYSFKSGVAQSPSQFSGIPPGLLGGVWTLSF